VVSKWREYLKERLWTTVKPLAKMASTLSYNITNIVGMKIYITNTPKNQKSQKAFPRGVYNLISI